MVGWRGKECLDFLFFVGGAGGNVCAREFGGWGEKGSGWVRKGTRGEMWVRGLGGEGARRRDRGREYLGEGGGPVREKETRKACMGDGGWWMEECRRAGNAWVCEFGGWRDGERGWGGWVREIGGGGESGGGEGMSWCWRRAGGEGGVEDGNVWVREMGGRGNWGREKGGM